MIFRVVRAGKRKIEHLRSSARNPRSKLCKAQTLQSVSLKSAKKTSLLKPYCFNCSSVFSIVSLVVMVLELA